MNDWRNLLNADPTDWLLEENNPSVRYLTLKDILDLPDSATEMVRAKQQIMQSGLVPEILRRQREPEYIDLDSRFYTAKYKGLVWQMIVLAELGAQANAQIREQCTFILGHSQEPKEGGFAMHAARAGGGRITEVIPCLTGNMVWSLIRFGYFDDPGVQKSIGWITRQMRFNDGFEEIPQDPPYDRYEMCWGKHTCHMGVVKALKGLSAIPEERRTYEVNRTIQSAAGFLLLHHIDKRSHDLSRISKPGWRRFGFPLMYQTDTLEILDILTGLGIRDSWMDEAVNLTLSKQDGEGRWHAENTYNSDRLLVSMEGKDQPSKWVTLRALRVIKRFKSQKPLR